MCQYLPQVSSVQYQSNYMNPVCGNMAVDENPSRFSSVLLALVYYMLASY